MIWLLARAGLSIGVAAAVGVPLVLGLRRIQVYLPGRSAEITDAMLVLMFAGTMKLAELAEARKIENRSLTVAVQNGF
jgi:hypothetical protein